MSTGLPKEKVSFASRLKDTLFQTYFYLINERGLSSAVSIILIIVSYLQLIGYNFRSWTLIPYNDSIYKSAVNIFEIVSISPAIFSIQNSMLTFIELGVLGGIDLIYIGLLYFVAYSLKIGKMYFSFPGEWLRILNLVILYIFFIPALDFFFEIIFCLPNSKAVLVTSCYQGMHYLYFVIAIIALLLMIGINIIISLFYNESSIAYMDSLGRLDSNLEIVVTIYKILLSFAWIISSVTNIKWIFTAFQLIGSAWLSINYFRTFPYYHETVDIIYGSFNLIYFSICIISFLSLCLESMNFQGFTYLAIIFSLGWLILLKFLREKYLDSLLFTAKKESLESTTKIEMYLKRMEGIIHQAKEDKVYRFLLSGICVNHMNECSDHDCPITKKDELFLPISSSILADKRKLCHQIMILHLISHMYQQFSMTQESSCSIHLSYSNFLSNSIGNYHQAVLELTTAAKCRCSIQQQFSIYRYTKKFEEKIFKNNKKLRDGRQKIEIDPAIVIQFEEFVDDLIKSMELDTNKHSEFWAELSAVVPDLSKIHDVGLKIMKCYKKSREVWLKILKINPNSTKALKLYGSYSNDILNDIDAGSHLLMQGEKIEQTKREKGDDISQFEQMFKEDTTVVIINGGKDSQGKISKTSRGVTRLFGYNNHETQGQDIGLLMPRIISEYHNQFLNNFFDTGRETTMGFETFIYGLHRTGYIIPISIVVSQLSSLEEGIQYIGIIKPVVRDCETMLVRENGIIDSMTSLLSGILGVSFTLVKENKVFIHTICPELYEEVGQHNNKKMIWNAIDAPCKLNFVIPKNFQFVLQMFSKQVIRVQSNAPQDSIHELDIENIVQSIYKALNNCDSVPPNVNILKIIIDYTKYEMMTPLICTMNKRTFGNGRLKLREIFIVQPSKRKIKDSGSGIFEDLIFLDTTTPQTPSKKKNNIDRALEFASDDNQQLLGKDNDNKNDSSVSDLNSSEEGKNFEDSDNVNLDGSPDALVNQLHQYKKTKGARSPGGSGLERKDTKELEQDDRASEASSVIEQMAGTMKAIRAAVFSDYIPPAIYRLKSTIYILSLILIILCIVMHYFFGYAISNSVEYLTYLSQASSRTNQFTTIAETLRMLNLLGNSSFKEHFIANNSDADIALENIRLSSIIVNLSNEMKDTQNYLSMKISLFKESESLEINPQEIKLDYLITQDNNDRKFVMDCWSTIMSLISYSLNSIQTIPPVDTSESFYFVLTNSFTSVIQAIGDTISISLKIVQNAATYDMYTLLIILLVTNVFIIASILFVFPIMYTVDRDKERMLLLFLDIPQEKIKLQSDRINKFYSIIHGDLDKPDEEEKKMEFDAANIISKAAKKKDSGEDEDDDNQDEDEKEDSSEKKSRSKSTSPRQVLDESKLRGDKKKGKRSFKSMPAKLHVIFVASFLILIISESFFFLLFFYGRNYTNNTISRAIELSEIEKRIIRNGFLYKSIIEMVVSNGTRQFYGTVVENFVANLTIVKSKFQKDLINAHSEYLGIHFSDYNDLYDLIMFNDTTSTINKLQPNCSQWVSNSLQRGLDESNSEFFDEMNFAYSSFVNAKLLLLDKDEISKILLKIIASKRFQEALNISQSCYDILYKKLSASLIDEQIALQSDSNKISQIGLIVYLILLLIQLILFVTVFSSLTMEALWVTRSFLTILPAEIIMSVTKIKAYIVSTSKTVLTGIKT